MADITPAIRGRHRLTAGLIPAAVVKAIPTQDELLDRIVAAEQLSARAATATEPALRRGYSQAAKAVLTGPPRAEAERLARAAERDGDVGKAAEIREAIAPRRAATTAVAVAKASAKSKAAGDDLVVCYDETGRPFGVAPRSKLIPVAPLPGREPVTKARPRRQPRGRR